MFFEPLKKLANNIIDTNVNRLINTLIEKRDFTELIIDLNTEKQLFNEGIDSLGVKLGEYSPFTKQLKQEKGLPIDRITLFDTGDFYKSFEIVITDLDDPFFLINANPIKDDTNLFIEYGVDILGLTEQSTRILQNKLQREIKKELTRIINK